jgi:hypothetical protein
MRKQEENERSKKRMTLNLKRTRWKYRWKKRPGRVEEKKKDSTGGFS